MEEIEDRILDVVTRNNAATLRTDAVVTLHAMDAPAGKVSLFAVSPLVRALKRLLGLSRPLRPNQPGVAKGGHRDAGCHNAHRPRAD